MNRREYQQAYRETHREQHRESVRQWKLRNPEKIREYREKNYRRAVISGAHRYWKMHRAAKRIGIPCLWDKADFIDWYKGTNKICFYCHRELAHTLRIFRTDKAKWEVALTLDRLDGSRGYEPNNVVLACRRCNLIKGDWFTLKQMMEIAKRYFI